LGIVDILVCIGPKTEPYFLVLLPGPPVGWWKAWFLLNDEPEALLPHLWAVAPSLISVRRSA
jgi:hypothetical protein